MTSLHEDIERWLDDSADEAAQRRLLQHLEDPAAVEDVIAQITMAGLLRTSLNRIPPALKVARVRALMAARGPDRRRDSVKEIRGYLSARRQRSWRPALIAMAASLLIGTLGLAGWWWLRQAATVVATAGHGQLADGRPIAVPCPLPSGSEVIAGDGLTLSWPDGSRVVLSAATQLVVTRDVLALSAGTLQAEIAHRPTGKPLIVRTPTMSVTVVGTRFSVEVEGSATTTRVSEGRVRVTNRQADERVLSAGDGARADSTGWIPERARESSLSAQELAAGWVLLFDGASTAGWRGVDAPAAPAHWRARDGVLERSTTTASPAQDLESIGTYGDFDLRFEWMIPPGGQSGVIYRAEAQSGSASADGLAYQIIDPLRQPERRTALTWPGACLGLIPASEERSLPAGAWNSGRILARGQSVEHWLNGIRVARFTVGGTDWEALVASSRYSAHPDHGTAPRGHIVLQDSGNAVAFRNLKILPLDRSAP